MADPGLFALRAHLALSAELDRWRRVGMRPKLWWRDDDARAPSAALDRLLDAAGGRPLALAVIPDGQLAELALRLRAEVGVTVGQHGVDHRNRRAGGDVRSEYPAPPTLEALSVSIAGGHARLQGAGLAPRFYTPPWNAVDPNLAEALARLAVPVLSAGAERIGHPDVHYMSAEIDVLSWKRGPRFRGASRILSALRRALAERRAAGAYGRPVGLLTHHLVHDAATWRFLGDALPWLDRRVDWVSVDVAGEDVASPRSAWSGAVWRAGMAERLAV